MAEPNVSSSKMKLPKKLIVLCDGTWQNSDIGWEKPSLFGPGRPQVPSNVTRFGRAIKLENKDQQPQIVYYQAGIGSSSWSVADHFLGGGLAYGVSQNIREAYGFIAHNFASSGKEMDEIFLVGFSRGAFTARSVGGMISKIGLLHKEAMVHFHSIFEDFENAGKPNYKVKLSAEIPEFNIDVDPDFAKKYLDRYKEELVRLGLARDVNIQAIFAMDTVGSLGLPVATWGQKLGLPSAIHAYRFFDTGISNNVKNAFHAIALDEHRSAFNASVWEKETDNKTTVCIYSWRSSMVTDSESNKKLVQVWFPGVHSNVGGGYDDSSISDLVLAWAFDQLGDMIEFKEEYLFEQFQANRIHNYSIDGDGTATKPKWTWGCGKIFNSSTFPTNITGTIDRTPGRYRKLDYETGQPDPNNCNVLENTNEYIHASVRARKEHGGLDSHNRPYGTPPALKHWDLRVKKDAAGKTTASWTYTSQKEPELVLPEAPLGRLERELLGYDKIMQSNLNV